MSMRGNRPPLPHRRALIAGAGALAAAATLFACTRNEVQPDETGRVRLRFALGGLADAGHGGFYQAVASGAYERRGLNVEILQGPSGADVPGLLASGTAELGLGADSFAALNLVAAGAPVKAVAACFQKDIHVLIAHPGPELEDASDLVGQPVYVPDDAAETAWAWLKARYGFTDASLRRYTGDPEAFLADERAVLLGTLTSTLGTVRAAADMTPRVLILADEGYPPYGGLVLAPNGFARDNARALRSFIVASAEGWRDYIQGDARAADALITAANPASTARLLTQGRDALRLNGVVAGGDAALYGLGAMTEDRWREFFVIASQAGLYAEDLDWRQAFTAQYLPGRG